MDMMGQKVADACTGYQAWHTHCPCTKRAIAPPYKQAVPSVGLTRLSATVTPGIFFSLSAEHARVNELISGHSLVDIGFDVGWGRAGVLNTPS